MISIIVSTYKPENFLLFEENIKKYIGVEYEIVPIHNPGLMSLCEAYNKGIELAKYPYLCFSHDDVLINLENWGHRIIDMFENNPYFGLLGIAGSTYKSWSLSGWFFPYDSRFCKMDLLQAKDRSLNNIERCLRNPPEGVKFAEVVTLDGCWMCTTAAIAKEFKFDAKTFTGYHCYDLDFAFQVGSKYKLGVLYDMELIHYSEGDYTLNWVIETFKLHKKWKDKLPITVANPISAEIADNEFKAYCFTMEKMLKTKAPFYPLFRMLYTGKLIKLVGQKKWWILQKWTWSAFIKKILR